MSWTVWRPVGDRGELQAVTGDLAKYQHAQAAAKRLAQPLDRVFFIGQGKPSERGEFFFDGRRTRWTAGCFWCRRLVADPCLEVEQSAWCEEAEVHA